MQLAPQLVRVAEPLEVALEAVQLADSAPTVGCRPCGGLVEQHVRSAM